MDIVEYLKKFINSYSASHVLVETRKLKEAADEIERLREILRWVIKLPEDSRIHAKVARKAFALKEKE